MKSAASAPALGGKTDEHGPVDAKPMFRLDFGATSTFMALRPEGAPPRTTWNKDGVLSSTSNSMFRLKVIDLPDINDKKDARYCKAATAYNDKDTFAHAAAQLNHHRVEAGGATGSTTGAGFSSLLGGTTGTGAAFPAAASFSGRSAGLGASISGSPGLMSPASSTGFGEKRPKDQPKKRSQKYLDLLLKNHYKRVDGWKDEEEQEAKEKAEFSAAYASRKALLRERRKEALLRAEERSRSSDEESEEESEEEPEDLGALLPFQGNMRVDLEIGIMSSPDEKEPSQADTSVPPSSSHSSHRQMSKGSSGSSDGGEKLDLANELAMLKEEMDVEKPEEEEEDSDEDLPEGLRLKKFKDVWDNPKPRWSLGIGGSVFFVPDAERYAFGPSLPPPPPASLHGRHRKRLKPRLPLDISNHRYRDEHPNIWPEPPYNPALGDYERFEKTMLTLDLYKSCNTAMMALPKLENTKDMEKHKTNFGKIIESETKRSMAWKNFNLREKLKRKEAAQLAKQEAERLEASRRAREIAAAAEEDGDY